MLEVMTTGTPTNALVKAQKTAEREKRLRIESEYEAEERTERGRAVLMTFGSDLAEDLGGALVGQMAAADMIVPGEVVGMVIGGIASAFRPFQDPHGVARLATSPLQGLLVGGSAIASFKSALRKRGKQIAPIPVP